MKHLGDIKNVNGAEIELVDCITFGSPCQDLSIANGNRKGLAGERSGLFKEAIRVIKEMREHDTKQLQMRGAAFDIRCIHPRFLIWENVIGAYSSNGGEDFRCVLEEFTHIREPQFVVPRCEKWGGAELSSEILGALHGAQWMLNTSEHPNADVESHLSWIVQTDAPEKYYLSVRACQGILNRASNRGKGLPKSLESALKAVIARHSKSGVGQR